MTRQGSSPTADDRRFMARALELAARGRGLTSPNPMVGAVVVRDGAAVGEGFHERAGGPHAEVVALSEAGARAGGATLYVTLEPCNHQGKTPPCVEAIVGSGIARVVVAVKDPNRRVRGGGGAALRAAGLDLMLGCLEEEARVINRAFFTAMERLRPHVTLKCAMTLDGKIAAFDKSARWITGEEARRWAHRLRSESDAVMIGIGTALQDDPLLTVRLDPPWPREPLRVVVDSRARLPLAARLIDAGSPSRVLVAVADEAPVERVTRLEARGLSVLACKSRDARVDLVDLCGRLYAMDVTSVLLEGGAELNGAFIEAGLVDRVAMFVAPLLIGGAAAPTAAGGRGLTLARALRLTGTEVRPVGGDWLIEGDVARVPPGT
ncbi:MAG TPA: bifunctional diaminohydroxyphosphoribosylaminopyrimidine deaminase/5-amino-6-(5-phosphoribosylamino)uracil reductase RibD [Methylomirabilota bacterium]|jgi:diaminohydroxyphosphoribosylaminopyrimidine deaminase/5-amino-6-(5-phosphoribosylamino)uracil reductase|nr:bifunctional diaminohydroxyphosphoribosylaminopyrimidine deaminase/5-amino-6-(5-phosphoribosylamino)uracil reductase RibD [Methylomirabilota bacterium]